MSKYSFDRMLPEQFESMAQALLEKTYRIDGTLIQFGTGADGAREATWTQPASHPAYVRPGDEKEDVPKEWVFQVKYHDIGLRGWSSARDAVVADLEKELDKVVNKYKVPCHAYVMITNVPFTGARNVGTRDKITEIAKKWVKHVPDILVWDAADLSRILDATESVRTAYLDTILPGDVLKALFKGATFHEDRTRSALRAYLKFVTDRERFARAEEAGDDPGLPLEQLFVDLSLRSRESSHKSVQNVQASWPEGKQQGPLFSANRFMPTDYRKTPASFALLVAEYPSLLILGGPGLGKSTLTQFLALYHAGRAVDPALAMRLAGRLKMPHGMSPKDLDAQCRPRFPLRLELRRYARWMSEELQKGRLGELARYIAEEMINRNVSGSLTMEDVFALASSDPILLILDGLDEVPHSETRRQILENLHIFLRRAKAEEGDILLLLSSRPKGYLGEFEGFEPLAWELNELERPDFDDYCNRWLEYRVRDAEERREARDRIDRGMQSESVQRLAQSLLQATVMLTIVRRKSEIPHQRHALYDKYVNVIFDREKEKSPVVRERATELLRLHERVGYELHRKMEQTRVESIDRESFRGFVLHVLEDYSGVQLGEKKLKDVADEIIAAATDRLCLLAGKGEEQTDIDFVVQAFREYFAATFLFNHSEADPDRVFRKLVERGAFWSNVLQFYVAQANPNQQIRWVLSADGHGHDLTSAQGVTDLVRLRRAILTVLPEMGLQRKTDFDRTLQIVFGQETRWTWEDQEPSLEILTVVRSGSAYQTLCETVRDLTSDDEATLAAELRLFAALTPDVPEERAKFHSLLEKLLKHDGSCRVALRMAVENDAPIDISSCDTATLRDMTDALGFGRTGHRKYRTLLGKQRPEKLCELLYAGWEFWAQDVPSPPGFLFAVEQLRSKGKLSVFNDNVELHLLPYVCRTRATVGVLDPSSTELETMESPYAQFLAALVNAAAEPDNEELDKQARDWEGRLPLPLSQEWTCGSILGPPPASFPTTDDWRAFRRLLIVELAKDRHWIAGCADFGHSSGLWTTFLIHADNWPSFVNEGLLSQQEWDGVRGSAFERFARLPKSPPEIFEFQSWSSVVGRPGPPLELSHILGAAFAIAGQKGVGHLGSGSVLEPVLLDQRVASATSRETEGLLRKASQLNGLSGYWICALLRLCCETPSLDLVPLLACWSRHESDALPFKYFLPRPGGLPANANELLQRLLACGEDLALRIAMWLVAGGPSDVRLPETLAERLMAAVQSLPEGHRDALLCLRALLQLRPTGNGFVIWQNPRNVRLLLKSGGWAFRRLIERIESATDPELDLNPRQLGECLAPFIIRRRNYPPEVGRAALRAMLSLQEGDMPTMQDDDWRQVR